METSEIYPWEQRDDEPDNAYRGFLAWRNLAGDRTLLLAYRGYIDNRHAEKVPDSFRNWYKEYDWASRSRAWDRCLKRREDEAMVNAREEGAKERGVTLADLETKGTEVAYRTAEMVYARLQGRDFRELLMPQQIAPMLRPVNETMKNLAALRHLKEDADAPENLTAAEEAQVGSHRRGVRRAGHLP